MESVLTIALGAFSFSLKIGRRWLVSKRLKDGDTTNKTLCQLILREIDEVKILLEKQKQLKLHESLHLFEEGLGYLDEVLSNESRDEKEMIGQAAELQIDCPWTFLIEADLLIKNMERLKHLPDQGEASMKVSKANERFQQAREKARSAFWNLQTSADLVLAANIGVTSVILENYKNPGIAMQEYKTWLKYLNGTNKVKDTFKRATKRGGINDDQKNCFLGVCHINRVIYEITQIAVSRGEMSWIWPCIELGEEKVDPLRDARVAKVDEKQYCLTLSFGQNLEGEQNLISARDIAVTKQGHFLIVDKGDQKIKTFDRKGKFLRSFYPLRRRLADQDVCGVTTDREDKLLVLTKLDKYHHEIYVFDQRGNLQNKFRLRKGLVRSSPIVNDKNEILVISEKPFSERSVVEFYKDSQYVGSLELKEPKELTKPSELSDSKGSKQPKDASEVSKMSKFQKKAEHSKSTKGTRKPKEPEDGDTKEQKKSQEPKPPTKAKDIAITDNGSVMVLNSDASVDKFKDQVQTKRQKLEGIPSKGLEAIAFHSLSKHVLITNSSDGIVSISVHGAEDGECVSSFHADEDRSGKKERKYIAPKIAVTAEGRIAVLTGFEGESKVIVV